MHIVHIVHISHIIIPNRCTIGYTVQTITHFLCAKSYDIFIIIIIYYVSKILKMSLCPHTIQLFCIDLIVDTPEHC